MHVVVSGGTGYLGSSLIKLFLLKGIKISILIRNKSSLTRIEEFRNSVNLVNIDESNKLENLFENESICGVIHTATCYGRKNETLNLMLESNLMFPIKLLEIAIKHKVQFFINTDTSLPRELNFYSLSKSQLKDWFKYYSDYIKIINAIPEYFYGPNDDENKFVTSVFIKMYNNAESIEFSKGDQLRDFIYIDDISNAFYCIVENLDKVKTLTDIPIGSSETISLKNMVLLIKDKLKNNFTKLNFGYLPTRPGEIMYSKADISILKSFGWHPKVTLDEGIQNIVKLKINK
ncbi:NAD(P)-dependent oxidoreductase [Aquirufa sp. HETE-83D]|uniref:NAD(P)-dependent oxidoreductase n=1 Tax=Aquirufa esocilacus TaxID=3096513 RepID=A0ABW6DJD3_9BACT